MTKAQMAINAEISTLEYAISVAEEVRSNLKSEGAKRNQELFILGMKENLRGLQND